MSFAEVLLTVAVVVVTAQLVASVVVTARARRRRAAEAHRTAVVSRHPSVHPPATPDPRRSVPAALPGLPEEAARAYRTRWAALECRFADTPVLALTEAEQLLTRLAGELGLPPDEPGRRTPALPAAQARVMADLRAGRAVEQRSTTQQADLDAVREAMRRFRRAFQSMLDGAASADRTPGDARSPQDTPRVA